MPGGGGGDGGCCCHSGACWPPAAGWWTGEPEIGIDEQAYSVFTEKPQATLSIHKQGAAASAVDKLHIRQ